MRILRLHVLLPLLVLLPSSPVEALTDEEIYEAFQFNFSLPGARSSAMGRAFVGLADDATASVSNPAGLATLQFPEVSLEVKLTDHDIRRRVGENASEPDTRVFGNEVPQLSFLGLVYRAGGLSLGLYRYETFNFDEQFFLPARSVRCCPEAGLLRPADAQIDMLVSNWGGTVAFRLPKNLSFGVAMSAALLDLDSRTTRLSLENPTRIESQTIVNDVAWALSSTLGALYRPSERFSGGLFYGFNPSFRVNAEAVGLEPVELAVPVRVKVPDRIGAGVAVRPADELTLVADVLRVLYSQQAGGNFRTLLRFPELNPRDFAIDDVWELHGGLEYVVLAWDVPLSLRAGLYTNPGHPLRYEGPTDTLQGKIASEVFGATSRGTDLAFTFGVGAVFSEYLQVDAAYLDSSVSDEVTVSMIFHIRSGS